MGNPETLATFDTQDTGQTKRTQAPPPNNKAKQNKQAENKK
jgi:hypothetical protein